VKYVIIIQLLCWGGVKRTEIFQSLRKVTSAWRTEGMTKDQKLQSLTIVHVDRLVEG
jgi:hypothetical protein